MRFFIMSIRYNNIDLAYYELIKKGKFLDTKDNSEWDALPMLDFGWGQEWGICRLPHLSREEIFNFIFLKDVKIV